MTRLWENCRSMRIGSTFKTFAVAMACLCTATGSAALTLGRVQGLAFIGQPLELRIQVQFDSSEDALDACLNAEVAYGDNPLDASRVSVAVEQSADPANRPALVRVRTSVPVNEPVVTVNLRSGCQVRSSKRYTLLADLPTQVVEPPVRASARLPAPRVDVPVLPAMAPATPARSSATPVEAPTQAAAPRREPVAAATPRPTTPRKVQPAPAAMPAEPAVAAPPVRLPKPAKSANKARLKLDPLDLLIEKDPVLRATDELLSLPQEGGARRAEAAALWRALNASPEQILREEVQAQRAAEDLKALYTVTNQNQKGLIELAAKVERAESERYANGLVYTLIALWVVSLAALVWMWQRMHAVQVVPDWRRGQDADDSLMAELVEAKSQKRRATAPAQPPVAPAPQAAAPEQALVAAVQQPVKAPAARASARPPTAASPLTEVDFDLDLIDSPWNEHLRAPAPTPASAPAPAHDPWATPVAAAPSAWRTLEAPTLPSATRGASQGSPHGTIDFSVSMSPILRSIDTEELEDVRHQAEFFVSLGQHDKAIDILTTRIAQCGESSPLVCLDLLKIYHALGREPEYTFMRTEFQHWFTGRVPDFADFGNEGRALDRYPQVMERIVKLWPGARVLEYIEECLYHHTGASDGQDFDLQAYRDLLLLHTVAKRIMRMASESGDPDSYIPDVVRIPARAQSNMILDTPDSRRTPTHRAGSHLRGGTPTRDALDEYDPQAEVETRGAPLGPMRVPPAPPQAEDPAADADTAQDHLTDFNFLNLR